MTIVIVIGAERGSSIGDTRCRRASAAAEGSKGDGIPGKITRNAIGAESPAAKWLAASRYRRRCTKVRHRHRHDFLMVCHHRVHRGKHRRRHGCRRGITPDGRAPLGAGGWTKRWRNPGKNPAVQRLAGPDRRRAERFAISMMGNWTGSGALGDGPPHHHADALAHAARGVALGEPDGQEHVHDVRAGDRVDGHLAEPGQHVVAQRRASSPRSCCRASSSRRGSR